MKKNLKKILFDRQFKANLIYTKYYKKNSKIRENVILFQSYEGSSISGNVFYMLKHIHNDEYYKKYRKIIVANNNMKDIKNFLYLNNINDNFELVNIHSRKYCKYLNVSKYLINNSTFPTYFIKHENQIYINTWHGTPLKNMGRDIISSPNEMGNTQRNFFMADYLLYQNEFMLNVMKKSYMLNNFYDGKYLVSGYPRNDIFYDTHSQQKIRKMLNLNDKKVFAYMPTWRGSLVSKENDVQLHYLMYALLKIDSYISNDTILYVKLHNYVESNIDFSNFEHIKAFPHEFETYTFLSIADCLITDYSSVFFDFANTNKKIILFSYDKKEYLLNRGLYLEYDKLPFEFANNIEELIQKMNKVDDYTKYGDFYNTYCNYDNINCTSDVCDYIFKSKKVKNIKVFNGNDFSNKKEKILIFGGSLQKNGITTALKGIFNNVDISSRNYILSFYKRKVESNKLQINYFNNIDYISLQGRMDVTLWEFVVRFMYFKLNVNSNYIKKIINNIYEREMLRLFYNIQFDTVIHFSGYERNIMHLFKNLSCNKVIYAHNDLLKEEKSKGNFHKNSLLEAYSKFNKIAVVRDSMKNNISGYLSDTSKVFVAHNFNNIDDIRNKKNNSLIFDSDTFCNISLQQLEKILNNNKITKFINIARFSKEKGLDRLIKAFNEFHEKNDNDCYLIIIGGYGNEFNNILNLVNNSSKNVIIIKSITNPYPILDKCDCFVLSSLYEGLPMTIMEALILNKKVISTDIEGPREFLKQGYGYLVEDSQKGIYNGFVDYKNGKLNNLKKFDAQKFNEKALEEFYNLIK